MEMRELGRDGAEVSAEGLGCVGLEFRFYFVINKARAISVIRCPAARGVTLFDTAEGYGPSAPMRDVVEASSKPLRTDRINPLHQHRADPNVQSVVQLDDDLPAAALKPSTADPHEIEEAFVRIDLEGAPFSAALASQIDR